MITKFKTKNKRYVCDVYNCNNHAYAEMYRLKGKKEGWMYVCKTHYKLKMDKNRKPKEKDIGFYILSRKETIVK